MRGINWGGNHTYRSAEVRRPTELRELQSIVRSNSEVSAIATRHSFNAIGDASTLIDLSELATATMVDVDVETVRCSPATTYAQLSAELALHGRALHNLASLPHISVGGAISTGTHGSGSRLGNLATAVEAIDLVVASGDVFTYRRGEPDFDGVVVGLGALGLIVGVELRTEPHYTVTQTVYDGLDWQTLDDEFDAISTASTSVSVFTRWADAVGEVWCKQRDDQPSSSPFDLTALEPAPGMRHPIAGAAPDACTVQLGRSGPWSERLAHFRSDAMPSMGNEIQAEFFVDRTVSAEVFAALRSIGPQLDRVLLVSEIRTVAADQLWMSPHHGRDSTAFHFTFRMDPDAVQQAVDLIGSCVAGCHPRFHPSKALPTGWQIASTELDRFLELRERLDPEQRFTTPWFRTHVADRSSGA
ncbi:MAG: FAD-binding protein [Ilumatobacter sp.]